jgi:hypothetical protein
MVARAALIDLLKNNPPPPPPIGVVLLPAVCFGACASLFMADCCVSPPPLVVVFKVVATNCVLRYYGVLFLQRDFETRGICIVLPPSFVASCVIGIPEDTQGRLGFGIIF